MNADGWGVGFFDGAPALAQPGSAVDAAHSVAPALRSHCILAAVRSATSVCRSKPRPRCSPDGHLVSAQRCADRARLPAGLAAEFVCD